MRSINWDRVWRNASIGLFLMWLLLLARSAPFPPTELKPRLNHLTAAQAFNFARWELKALGDKHDPAHTETWTSPVITIDRP